VEVASFSTNTSIKIARRLEPAHLEAQTDFGHVGSSTAASTADAGYSFRGPSRSRALGAGLIRGSSNATGPIFDALVDLARKLDILTAAEGVETEEQRR
jgi:hypothetical protein